MLAARNVGWLGEGKTFNNRLTVTLLIIAAGLLAASPGWPAVTVRVSVASGGTQSDGGSGAPAISADGRFVAFASVASNLVAGDTGFSDVFVHDRATGQTSLVSVALDGTQADGWSEFPSISADGRYIAFLSWASNLVSGDRNGREDVFVRDRLTGVTERASVASDGAEANDMPWSAAISADGRFVAFGSSASNLVADDSNGVDDVFLRDVAAGQTTRVSLASDGTQSNAGSRFPALSADGRYVAFDSGASNLVAGDTNNQTDVFIHDTVTGQTTRVSVGSGGVQGNNSSAKPSISADGRYVAFDSDASNLVVGDTNGLNDCFVRDRSTGQTTRVSLRSDGTQAEGIIHARLYPAISGDGLFVAFASFASNLVPEDTNGVEDVFVHDRATGQTTRASVDSDGTQGNGRSTVPSVSADGRCVTFASEATNLVPADTNGYPDVFVLISALAPPALVISGGATCTNSTGVNLSVTCGECAETRFRNDPGDWGPWEPFTATRAWTLTSGDGIKRVCVQGRDAALTESAEACDEILLDTTPPGATSVSINGGAACTDSASVTLAVTAIEADEMRFRNDAGTWSSWEIFSSSKAWTLSSARGTRSVGFQARDACGNIAAEVTDTIVRPAFDDVACANSQRPSVEALVRQAITIGCSTNPPLYCPEASANRAQMAVLLCRAAGKATLNRNVPSFADVPKTHWAYGYIERLADAASWPSGAPTGGCAVDNPGTPENEARFCPGSVVTRQQMAKFLCIATNRAAMPSCSGTFADVGADNPFCRFIERLTDPASWPGGVAVTSGCATNPLRYCPKSVVTRGQMAVFLVRAFGIPL